MERPDPQAAISVVKETIRISTIHRSRPQPLLRIHSQVIQPPCYHEEINGDSDNEYS
ncbi:hypothetical protein LX36DRAFT_660212 [Colletotrichum falcatum]|nr:hypothetical protein LX36DRAFT_660212 [Colletotrichum falcatum]